MNITDLLLPEDDDGGGGGDEAVIVCVEDAVIGIYIVLVK